MSKLPEIGIGIKIIYIFITLLHELLFIYKKTNTYCNAMIGNFKSKMQSNESPKRTKGMVGMNKRTLKQIIHTYINI